MLNRSASLAISTNVLKALPGKLDIKRHSPSILYIQGLEENYCRNPDSDERPWCYVDNTGKYNYCRLKRCEETTSPDQSNIGRQTTPLPPTTTSNNFF